MSEYNEENNYSEPQPKGLHLKTIIADGWHAVHGLKASWWGGFFIIFGVAIGAIIIVGAILTLLHWVQINSLLINTGFDIILQLLLLPLIVGLVMLSVRQVAGLPHSAKRVFNYYHWSMMWRFLVVAAIFFVLFFLFELLLVFLHTILPKGSYFFLILWGILVAALVVVLTVLSVAYNLSLIHLADRQQGVRTAIREASAAVFSHWLKILILVLYMWALTILGTLTLGIIYIWFFPYFNNMMAVLYRELIGINSTN